MRRVVVTGSTGLLGTELCETFSDADLVPLAHSELDITDPVAVEEAFAAIAPDLVVNAAAVASPDSAVAAPDRAFAVNAVGPGVLGRAAAGNGAVILHVSTDYVFRGDHASPGAQDALYCEWDRTGPVNVYGRSKLAGEWAVRGASRHHVIVRTSWVFGARGGATTRVLRELETEGRVHAWKDQWNVPTPVGALAGSIRLLAERRRFGTWHVCGRGKVSRYDWARAVLAEIGEDPDRVVATSMSDSPMPSPRPVDTGLDTLALRASGLAEPGDWRPALSEALAGREWAGN